MKRISKRREYYRQYQAVRKARLWPKCAECGHIARRLPDVGCLNCHALSHPRRDWNPAESDVIENHAGRDDAAHLQYRIYIETGIARSRDAIRNQVKVMGIKTADHQDGYTIAQLVKITGHPYQTIHTLIRDGVIKNIGRGRRILISDDDAQRVIARYSKAERPSYSFDEVLRLIGCDRSTLQKAFKRGLPSWKEGHARRVCKDTVDRAVAHLRDTGKVRIHWRLIANP